MEVLKTSQTKNKEKVSHVQRAPSCEKAGHAQGTASPLIIDQPALLRCSQQTRSLRILEQPESTEVNWAFSLERTIISTYLKLLTSLALTCELTGIIAFWKFSTNTAHPIPMTAVLIHPPASVLTLLP